MRISNHWKPITVVVILLLAWILIKLFIGMTRLAFWFALLGVKLTVLFFIFAAGFVLYLKLKHREKK